MKSLLEQPRAPKPVRVTVEDLTIAPFVKPVEPTAAPTPENIFKVGFGFWASKTLLSAVELDVFTVLARTPMSLEGIANRLGLHARSARDFLDALVALGFLQRKFGVYSNTRETDLFLDKAKPSYLGGILQMANARLYPFWGGLTEGLKTGEAQNEAKRGGANFFEALYAEPQRLKQFLAAMTGISRGANLAIAQNFSWAKYRTFADVGTAQGDLAAQVALANPHLRGIGFDLPQVRPIFNDYVAQLGLAGRLSFRAGDFFQQALPKVDVIMMGHILHDWDLAQKKQLIQAAWDALPTGGALIVYDSIIDDDRRHNAFGLLMSLNMLIETPGGFDYTGADCIGWMKHAGFREACVQHLVGPDSMVVGIK
jgi:precorrin-6B methylase 2